MNWSGASASERLRSPDLPIEVREVLRLDEGG